jgi:hypothetical protein
MPEEPTTTVIQRYLDALPGNPDAEPVIRELLERAAVCACCAPTSCTAATRG